MPRKDKKTELTNWLIEYRSFVFNVKNEIYSGCVTVLARNETDAMERVQILYGGFTVNIIHSHLPVHI